MSTLHGHVCIMKCLFICYFSQKTLTVAGAQFKEKHKPLGGWDLSCVMRKHAFCMYENKDIDQPQ